MSNLRGLEALFLKDTVNLRNPQDVELWTYTLNIYTAELVAAVTAVGSSPSRVLEYLQQHAQVGRRVDAPDRAPSSD